VGGDGDNFFSLFVLPLKEYMDFCINFPKKTFCTLHTGFVLVPRVQKLSEKKQKQKQNKARQDTGKEVEKKATGPHQPSPFKTWKIHYNTPYEKHLPLSESLDPEAKAECTSRGCSQT
jgi:hypothetical protein